MQMWWDHRESERKRSHPERDRRRRTAVEGLLFSEDSQVQRCTAIRYGHSCAALRHAGMKQLRFSGRAIVGLLAAEALLLATPFAVQWTENRWHWVDDQTPGSLLALLTFWGSIVLASIIALLLIAATIQSVLHRWKTSSPQEGTEFRGAGP